MNQTSNQSETTRSQGIKPGLVSTTGAYCVVALILILTIGLVVTDSLKDISSVATHTRDNVLPAIIARQRTAVNLEKMGRFAEIVYRSHDHRARRQYKLAAYLLSQDSVFEEDPTLNKQVITAYKAIEEIADLRDEQEAICKRCSFILFDFLPDTHQGKILWAVPGGNRLMDLMFLADKAETPETLTALREEFTRLTQSMDSSSPNTASVITDATELFDNREKSHAMDISTEQRWRKVNILLEEMSANLSMNAAVTADERFTTIVEEADRAMRTGLLAAGALMLALLVLLFFAQRDIVVPIIRYVQGLDRIGQGERDIDLPKARLKELDDIRSAVERSATLMTQLAAKTRGVQEANKALESEIEIRTQAQKDLALAKERAESADRAKSEFLAGMSHEIRTPMNTMLGMGELILETDPSPTQRKYIEIFQSSGEMLLGLINDVLDLSKIESGQIELESVPIDRDEFLARTQRIVAGRAEQKGLDFVIDVHDGVPRTFMGDPTRLRQVLVNLIDNGVKFTDKGEVRLILKQTDNNLLTFAVIDTGIGIMESVQEQIFRRFTQADTSTTREYGGTGLGLAISRRLVELMGGTIELISTPGEGSAFHFSLKLAAVEQATKEPIKQSKGMEAAIEILSNTPMKILVAEDSESNQALIELYFKKTACHLDFAADGRKAVELYETTPYDLVLMDIQMPTMDGYEATRMIRSIEQERGTPPVPIVAVTANAFKEDQERCLEAGCNDYLAKPVRKNTLLECAAKYVRHS